MTYEVVLAESARRTLEKLPGPTKDEVLQRLGTELEDDSSVEEFEEDEQTYFERRVAPGLAVIYRPLSNEERIQHSLTGDEKTVYAVLGLVPSGQESNR
jgi:hypothetical protein